MNRKTVIDYFSDIIHYFKNSAWRIDSFRSKELQPSYTPISDDAVFNQVKNTQMSLINQFLSDMPKHINPHSKSMSVSSVNRTDNVLIYPNRHYESVINSQEVQVNQVPVILTDKDNEIIDARVRGGGLKDEFIVDKIGNNPFINSLTDIGRYGMPSAASASIMIELPSDIKNIYKESTIREAIGKYLASGVHVSISYYEGPTMTDLGWKLQGSETA